MRNLVPPVILIFAVLGSILLGWASPTKAAAIGAIASVGLTALYGNFHLKSFYEALIKTLKVTAMIMTVLLAGTLFTGVFIGAGGIATANNLIGEMRLTPWMLLGLMMLIIFISGFFLDWISIVLIFVPIFTPLARTAGFDAVWFCVLFLVLIQTSYLRRRWRPLFSTCARWRRRRSPSATCTAASYRSSCCSSPRSRSPWHSRSSSRGCRPRCSSSAEGDSSMTPEQILSHQPRVLTQKQREFYFEEGYLLLEENHPGGVA